MPAPVPSVIGPVRPRYRFTGAAGPPAIMYSGEISYSGVDDIFYVGIGDDGTGVATSTLSIGGKGAFIAKALFGVANGVPQLDGSGKLPNAYLQANILGAMQYQGVWNASTNSPTLTSGTGTKGQFYKVGTAGTTTLDGLSQWNVGDLVLFDGATWDKIDGIASEVLSVAGRTGTVVLTSSDLTDSSAVGRALLSAASVAAQRVALLIDAVASVADMAGAITAAVPSLVYTALTAARAVSLPAIASMNPGQRVCVADMSGNCSSSLTITLNPNAAEKINGAASFALNQAYQSVALEVKGGGWNIVSVYPPAAAASSGGVNGGSY